MKEAMFTPPIDIIEIKKLLYQKTLNAKSNDRMREIQIKSIKCYA